MSGSDEFLGLSPTPRPMDAVHAELGSSPASAEDFESLAELMSEPDGEG
ncbi:MAG: hypothetical protein WBC01_07140 [Solirubrobacterales bacterium]